MDHPDFIACSFMENSISLKMVKDIFYCLSGNQPKETCQKKRLQEFRRGKNL